jgi:hypothetical protein
MGLQSQVDKGSDTEGRRTIDKMIFSVAVALFLSGFLMSFYFRGEPDGILKYPLRVLAVVVPVGLFLVWTPDIQDWITRYPDVSKALGVGLAGLLTLYQLSRNMLVKNTVAERREWRKKLRKIAEKETLTSADIEIVKANINPYSGQDAELWVLLKQSENDDELIKEQLRLLLKYDWDRSKAETSVFFWWILRPLAKWKYQNR